ncbi:MAG: winged helix-turn-helix domain-containing protein [Erysipelotrichaceae bacterium]|nr:winged helix-turn-helix domain-containing protein [Erysipelotrichaceae bacterium]
MALVEIQRSDGSLVQCDTEKHTLSYYRYHVRFTPLEWKIVKMLYDARPNVVSRDDLIQMIWESEGGEGRYQELKASDRPYPTRTIDVHISSIRRKLAYIKGARIDSVYGVGYRLLMLKRF